MLRFIKPLATLLGWLTFVLPAAAIAAPVELCAGQIVAPDAGGRVLGHLPYGEAAQYDLLLAPPGFSMDQPCRLQRAAAVDLTRMLREASIVPGVADGLRGVSCYRSIEHQRRVFCGRIGFDKTFATAAERARYVGPPGYSEHATGFSIDFGIRPQGTCPDVDACLAQTIPGRWLLAHARDYGFELSFPVGNRQGVTWEPWHWRWVGTADTVPGAGAARAIFARARATYPALPGLPDPPKPVPPPPFPFTLLYPRLPGI